MVLTSDAVLTIVRHYALPIGTHEALLFCIGNACLLGTSLLNIALLVRHFTAYTAYYCTAYYNIGCQGNVYTYKPPPHGLHLMEMFVAFTTELL
jgi:hypothetical protein